jgi:hypothetical protein
VRFNFTSNQAWLGLKRVYAVILISRSGFLPDRKLDLPADAGVLDTLAIARLLSPEEVVNQGLRERVEAAQRQTSDAVSTASEVLRDFGVQRERIQELIDDRIKETSEKLGSVIRGQF